MKETNNFLQLHIASKGRLKRKKKIVDIEPTRTLLQSRQRMKLLPTTSQSLQTPYAAIGYLSISPKVSHSFSHLTFHLDQILEVIRRKGNV